MNHVNGKKEGEGLVLSSKKTSFVQLNFREDILEGTCVLYDNEGRKCKEYVFMLTKTLRYTVFERNNDILKSFYATTVVTSVFSSYSIRCTNELKHSSCYLLL